MAWFRQIQVYTDIKRRERIPSPLPGFWLTWEAKRSISWQLVLQGEDPVPLRSPRPSFRTIPDNVLFRKGSWIVIILLFHYWVLLWVRWIPSPQPIGSWSNNRLIEVTRHSWLSLVCVPRGIGCWRLRLGIRNRNRRRVQFWHWAIRWVAIRIHRSCHSPFKFWWHWLLIRVLVLCEISCGESCWSRRLRAPNRVIGHAECCWVTSGWKNTGSDGSSGNGWVCGKRCYWCWGMIPKSSRWGRHLGLRHYAGEVLIKIRRVVPRFGLV